MNTKQTEQATARPWQLHGLAIYAAPNWKDGTDFGSQFVAQVQDDDDLLNGITEASCNAALIVQAVNEHAALVAVAEVLEEMTARYSRLETLYFKAINQDENPGPNGTIMRAESSLAQLAAVRNGVAA